MFRIVTGIIVTIVGLCFVFLAVTTTWFFLIHAAVTVGIGVAILFNTKEDAIEEIKTTSDKEE